MSRESPLDAAAIRQFLQDADEYIVARAPTPLDQAHQGIVKSLTGLLEALLQDSASTRLRADLAAAVQTAKAAGLTRFGRHVFDGVSYIEFAEALLNAPPHRGLRQVLDDHAAMMRDAAFALNHPGTDAEMQTSLDELSIACAGSSPRCAGRIPRIRRWRPTIAELWLRTPPAGAGPGAQRMAAPPFTLAALREWIERGETPDAGALHAAVRDGIREERNAPYLEREKHFPALGAAAMLSRDGALWNEVVEARLELEGDSYDNQAAAGVTRDDRGPRPTRTRCEGFVRVRTQDFLKGLRGALAEELRSRAMGR